MSKIEDAQAKFHRDKAANLEREYHLRKSAGEKRIWAAQQELDSQLVRILLLINSHREKGGLPTLDISSQS